MKRLDIALSEIHLCSRSKAKDLIVSGKVFVNQAKVITPSHMIKQDDCIEVNQDTYEFVSRSGYKLLESLQSHAFSAVGKHCLDIGASTGGFTDCLLQFGAESVVALDVGTLQLDNKLREDPRVIVRENTNAKYMSPTDFPQPFDVVVMDVSFISIKVFFERIAPLLASQAQLFILIKPQFEVGPTHLNKHGIVKNPRVIQDCLQDFRLYFKQQGYQIKSIDPCSVLGRGGNQEYIAYLTYIREEFDAKTDHSKELHLD